MAEQTDAWWHQALADFGGHLGFEQFSDSHRDVHNFVVGDNKYLLDIECLPAEIIMAVLVEIPGNQVEQKLTGLLTQCNYDQYLPFFVQVGLKEHNILVLAVRLDKEASNQMIQAFDFICKLYADAGM